MRIRKPGKEILVLGLILAIGAALRFYGQDWDGGHWLHPDERKIYFVVMGLDWPRSMAEALSPDSPLNPQFFAYGSLPIYLLKLAATLARPLGSTLRYSGNLHLIGRSLVALFDLGTVYLTYRLARTLLPFLHTRPEASVERIEGQSRREREALRGGALFAAALVSLAVLHVQNAHYYTVDPLLTFFVMLTLSLAADVARGGGRRHQVALGIALGLALATKVSAAPLLLVVWVAYSARHTRHESPVNSPASRVSNLFAIVWPTIGTLVLAGTVFFVAQPYALIDWRTFLDDTIREAQIARGTLDVPYTLQYTGTWPFLYSMWQTALWGLGLPLGLTAWVALAASLLRWLRRGTWADLLLLAWAGPSFVIVGLLQTRYLRYVLPLAPVLCILAVHLLMDLGRRRAPTPGIRHWGLVLGGWSVGLLSLAYALAFASIYRAPHPWIAASEWIYREAPTGSTLATLAIEHWDMALPLPLGVDGQPRRHTEYELRILPLYDEPDDTAKWETVAADLADSDYLIVASRRLYGSIPRAPDRYPVATRYYQQLFAGELGFELVGEFTRGPEWLNPRLPPLPGNAPAFVHPDESFVVYDHPRASIFYNTEHLPVEELLRRLEPGRE